MGVVLVIALLTSAIPPVQAAEPACPDPSRLPPTAFADLVSTTHRRGITCSAWYGLANGTRPTVFRPRQAVRRDQMAAFLARTMVAANVPLPSEPPQPFADVAASAHRDAIAQMAELGLVQGMRPARYEPAAGVTRGQMAAFLVRLAKRLGVAAPATRDAFADDDGTAHEREINRAAALGLALGVRERTFVPGLRIRREQMASMLARLIEVLVDHGALNRRPIPAFASSAAAVPDAMRAQMIGVSWHNGCPVSLDDLVVLNVTHWDFNGEPRRGHLIVARSAAGDLAEAFGTIYAARFQIERMRPVHTYAGGERASLSDNNTSAFHCRTVTRGSSWSQHSYGTAVDINPRQHIAHRSIRGRVVLSANERPSIDRAPVQRGMIEPTGPVTRAFKAIGWEWGGDWRSRKDSQHFSANGR